MGGVLASSPRRTGPLARVDRELAALGALILLAAGLRFGSLGSQSFWYDEAVTGYAVSRPGFGALWHAVAQGESTPPLFYIVTWLTAKVGGQGDVSVRFVSALSGTAIVPVAWACARKLADARAGLLAAALAAASPLLISYSQEARAYSLLTFLCAVSFLLLIHGRERPTKRVLGGWAAVSVAALCTHYFAAFVVGPEAVALLWRSRAPRRVWAAVGVVAAAGAALLPLFLEQRSHGATNWISDTALSTRLSDAGQQFAKGVVATPGAGFGAAAVVLVALGLLAIFVVPSERRTGALLAFGVGAAAFALPLAMAVAGADVFLFRNLLGAWVPLAVAVALGLSARKAGLVVGGLLCLVWLVIWVSILDNPSYHRDDWKSAARDLDYPRANRALVLIPGYAIAPLARYGHLGFEAKAPFRTKELVIIGVYNSGIAPRKSPGGLRLTERRQVQKIGIARYRSRKPVVVNQASFHPPGSPVGSPRLYLEPGRPGAASSSRTGDR